MEWKKAQCEYLRSLAKQKFNQVKGSWMDVGKWALPHRTKWLLASQPGERNNQHIVDTTHKLALRSYVAGFLEGNTSASRPWSRIQGRDPDLTANPINKAWLEKFTKRIHNALITSNFYHAAGQMYYDYGVFNTGAYYIEELSGFKMYWHNLVPGSYYVINNSLGEAVILVREMSLSVKALVDAYGKKVNGNWDWSNFSSRVRKFYEDGLYTTMIDIVSVVKENEYFDAEKPQALLNKRWICLTYELGGPGTQYYQDGQELSSSIDPNEEVTFLEQRAAKRKPFIISRSDANSNFEYGETGPTTDALGLIKSLNKKAIAKDQAIEQMLRPALQGPANLKKSYITTASNSYVPLDATSLSQKGLRSIFEVNPAIGTLLQDVSDLRQQIDKLYYADYLLFLSRNPKTRTATETNAVVQEQQLIIGPNLQSLNWTHNLPVVEYVMDYVLFEDPYLEPPPESLAGQFLHVEFISVFAQAQRAADLPAINQYMAMVEQVGQLPGGMKIWDKVNLDRLADLYEDRLYLPSGLNNPQAIVDAQRQQAQMMQQRQQMLEKTVPAMAGAAKDLGHTVKQ